jgi:HlyD family secretion protein
MTLLASARRHPVRWGLAAALVLVAVLTVSRALRPTPVDVVSLETRDLVRTFVLTGRVRPPSTARLGASVAGAVQRVEVREGDRVTRGETLVRLDDREPRARLREAEAALVEATASTESTVEVARGDAQRAERDLERTRAMFEEGARTQQQVETAEQRWLEARTRLETLLASSEGAGPDGTPASVLRARATVEAARARLDLVRIDAPADGVVLSRSVEPGDVAQPGQPLLEIAFDGPSELVVFPAEEDIGALRVGAPAMVSADAYPDLTFEAEVSLVFPSVDPDQGTVEVRLSIPDPPEYLRPFMTVSVNIEAARKAGASVLPAEAVGELGTDAPWVQLVRNGRIERQPVEVGIVGEEWVEILSGLGAADEVVLSGTALEPGTRVRRRGSR